MERQMAWSGDQHVVEAFAAQRADEALCDRVGARLVLQEYIEHYNTHRPHRSLHQQPPTGATPPPSKAVLQPLRRDRLGGLVHEYVQVA